jgi:hypothetical protein
MLHEVDDRPKKMRFGVSSAAVVHPVPGRTQPGHVLRFVGASLGIGLAFAVLDGVVNANPLAQTAYAVFDPIARPGLNVVAGIVIDLAYGFVLCAIFWRFYPALPGATPLRKGISYALLVWFFRVVMNAAGQWMVLTIPGLTVAYTLAAGLLEMVVLGVLLAVIARPTPELPKSPLH